MDTSEHLNSTVGAHSKFPVFPGVFSGPAWALGSFVLVLASRRDPCAASYSDQGFLKAVLVVALVLQGAALVVALVRASKQLPRSGRSLVGTFLLSVCALPGALIVYAAITGVCLGGDFAM